MLRRWQGWIVAVVVMVMTAALVAFDVADGGFRRWWDARALTTDTVAGLLVFLITVLVSALVGWGSLYGRLAAARSPSLGRSMAILASYRARDQRRSAAHRTSTRA